MKFNRKNLWKYILGLGTGMGLGYLLYKRLFTYKLIGKSNDSLTKYESLKRSELIGDIKYNLNLKFDNNDYFEPDSKIQKSLIRGIVDIEFNLKKHEDIFFEFSGLIISLQKIVADLPVKINFEQVNNRIIIHKKDLTVGQNKLSFHFCVNKYDRGIIRSYLAKVNNYFFIIFLGKILLYRFPTT